MVNHPSGLISKALVQQGSVETLYQNGNYYYCYCYWLMRRLKAGVRVQDAATSLIIQQPPTPLVRPLQAAHCQFVK